VTVIKEPLRELLGRTAPVAAALLLLAAAAGAAGRGREDGIAVRFPEGRIVLGDTPGAKAAEPLLARLWASGFFRRNEAVLREFLNNDYALFDAAGPNPPDGVQGLACFSKKNGRKDTIFLRKDLFAHFDVGLEGTVERADVGGCVLSFLVHEIFHDLWLNVLDDQERAAFSREGEAFMKDFRMAQTAEDKRLFLLLAGDDAANPRCLRSYAGIGDILAANPTRALCGHEMFAWLAERLFTTRAMIPCPLRKYYSCVLAGIPTGTAGTK
jgi:hypothetical protein